MIPPITLQPAIPYSNREQREIVLAEAIAEAKALEALETLDRAADLAATLFRLGWTWGRIIPEVQGRYGIYWNDVQRELERRRNRGSLV